MGLSAVVALLHVEFFRRVKGELSPKWSGKFPDLAPALFALKEAALFLSVLFCSFWAAFFAVHTIEMNFISHIRIDDGFAESTLRRYAGAQEAFSRWAKMNPKKANTLTRATGSTMYADNFRNLHYGFRDERSYPTNPAYEGQINEFIGWPNWNEAESFLYDNALGGAPTASADAPSASKVDSAYYFQEDPTGILPAEAYGTGFALMAFPRELGITGNYVFWVGNGTGVYRQRPNAPKGTSAAKLYELYRDKPGATPAAGQFESWERLYWLPERNEILWRPALAIAIVLGLLFQGTKLETSLRFRQKIPENVPAIIKMKQVCFVITAIWFLFMGPALLLSLLGLFA